MSFIDDFSPSIIGSDRFTIALSSATLTPRVGEAVLFDIGYDAAGADGGVVLPLELIVQSPAVAGFMRKTFRRFKPVQVSYFPITAGEHLVRIAETGHNLFFGALAFTVLGDAIDEGASLGRRRAV